MSTTADRMLSFAMSAAERGLVPDAGIRLGIRRLCASRLEEQAVSNGAGERLLERMAAAGIALVPEKANEQHYELPPEFFGLVLGPHRKYSGCYWPEGVSTLARAEEAALALTCERAGLEDGQKILELGCGWGSLSLEMARRYPSAKITAVSNSAPQREFIQAEARRRGLENLEILTVDMNRFQPAGRFDRVVSVEMFEHMRNWRRLLGQIESWLEPGGALFVHIFCHRRHLYEFETEGAHNWMGRYFFTGGLMPSFDIFHRIDSPLAVEQDWIWDGTHYQKTAEAWLANMDGHRAEVLEVLESAYGKQEAPLWFQRWRVFFMACAELFGFRDGSEWQVGHYRLRRR